MSLPIAPVNNFAQIKIPTGVTLLMRLFSAILCILLLASAGCVNRKVYPLTSQKFTPTAADQEVKLYVNEIEDPHVKIAMIQSFADGSREDEIVRRQLTDMTERARKLGADAVVNVRVLKNKVRGYTVDERVPFRAYEQGNYELYFLRGTAIKYVDEEEFWGFGDPLASAETLSRQEGIPEVLDRDEQDIAPIETVPRGLAPTYRR